MSTAEIEATALLCRLLEGSQLTIGGKAVHEGEWVHAAQPLLNAHLLAFESNRQWAECYECWVESARVVDDPPKSYAIPEQKILQLCPECGPVEAPAYVRQIYRVLPARLITKLLIGLEFSPTGSKSIDKDRITDERQWQLWRLGISVPKRGKQVTWYFGRQLHQPEVALRLREQIAADKALQSCVILTSSEVPLPAASALTGFDVRSLMTVGQIEAHSFTFFPDRHPAPGVQRLEEAAPDTTLRYLKPKGLVYIDGEAIKLEPRERNLLIALIDDLDHEMDNDGLRDKVGSVAKKFSPSKVFDRKPRVYRTFVRFLREDGRYQLQIPPEDRSWLI